MSAATGGAPGLLDPEERGARAALTRVAEPGDPRLAALVAQHGAAAVLAALTGGGLGEMAGAPSARRTAGYLARLGSLEETTDLARPAAAGIRLVCPGEPEWPGQLDDLGLRTGGPDDREPLVPPYALWVRGALDLRLTALRSVAVIGARAATGYGEHVATEIATVLGERGWTVVSGAAFGVDAAAHRGALAVGAPTIAVMACGVDQAYPRGHDLLVRRIAEQGCVVSELPPGATVTRSRLLQRNRLVAALTRGTVVVEAAVRSGTSTTARQAGRLGRVVMAVPGPVTSPASVGCHELIRGARALLVTDAADVVDAVGLIGQDLADQRRSDERGAAQRPEDGLDAETLRVLDALRPRKPLGLARVAAAAALDLPGTRSALGLLLDLDLAEQADGGYRLSANVRERRRHPPDDRDEAPDPAQSPPRPPAPSAPPGLSGGRDAGGQPSTARPLDPVGP